MQVKMNLDQQQREYCFIYLNLGCYVVVAFIVVQSTRMSKVNNNHAVRPTPFFLGEDNPHMLQLFNKK